jgi:hypothetical protein
MGGGRGGGDPLEGGRWPRSGRRRGALGTGECKRRPRKGRAGREGWDVPGTSDSAELVILKKQALQTASSSLAAEVLLPEVSLLLELFETLMVCLV